MEDFLNDLHDKSELIIFKITSVRGDNSFETHSNHKRLNSCIKQEKPKTQYRTSGGNIKYSSIIFYLIIFFSI